MALACFGLLASAALYLLAIYGILWSSLRRTKVAADRGIEVDAPQGFPSVMAIVRRHSVEWAVGFLLVFIILSIADFSLWEQWGIAVVLAIVFGSMWLSQSEPGGTAEETPFLLRVGSSIWYWSLAVGDWLGFLGILCFASAILVRAIWAWHPATLQVLMDLGAP
jgi:hypothetical protein